jgi:hypothetical protein
MQEEIYGVWWEKNITFTVGNRKWALYSGKCICSASVQLGHLEFPT